MLVEASIDAATTSGAMVDHYAVKAP